MYNLDDDGFIYIKGQIGSFVPFFLSRTERKVILFYDSEDEALLLREEMEYFSGQEVCLFPLTRTRCLKKRMR